MTARHASTAAFVALGALLLVAADAASAPSCLIVHDAVSAQDLKIEAHGANAVRVRAVPTGGTFKDDPDVISALISNSSRITQKVRR